ncbi:hypothetical protein ACI6QG_04550 [Roseococcus sp. DSY-14]|uniref:hypothetical protein n=1 Tax=Roseococcus sp. DSY-14 TaxID=3369650 RepID=UPI00387B6D67
MAGALLAIWGDVLPEAETEHLHWLLREHTAERLGVPGFLAVRVLRSAPGRTLILYELADAAVLSSPAYLARLDAPTPWSRRIMPMLRGFARGGGPVVAALGAGQGGCVLAWRLDAAPAAALPDALLEEDRVCALRLMVVDRAGSGLPTTEKALRGGDAPFTALLLLEGTDAAALRQAAARHGEALRALGATGEGTAHATVFAMRA